MVKSTFNGYAALFSNWCQRNPSVFGVLYGICFVLFCFLFVVVLVLLLLFSVGAVVDDFITDIKW